MDKYGPVYPDRDPGQPAAFAQDDPVAAAHASVDGGAPYGADLDRDPQMVFPSGT